MNSFALARSITSSINSVPTPESWAWASMVIGPTPAIVDPTSRKFVPTMRPCCSAATEWKPGCVSRSGRSPAAVFAEGKSGGKLVPLQRPGTPRSKSALLARRRLPGLVGAWSLGGACRVLAGNQEEVPFAPVPRWPPELEGQRDDHGDRDHDPEPSVHAGYRFGPEVGRSVGFHYEADRRGGNHEGSRDRPAPISGVT
jgi:hypothetical protein